MTSRIVYVNGQFLPESEASVSIFDRGFLFADGVYEVTAVLWGSMIDNDRHLSRLAASLAALAMPAPMDNRAIEAMQRELIARNRLEEGLLYLQITRGAADRDFAFPEHPQPTCVAFTQQRSLIDLPLARSGIRVLTVPDIRWGRCDIKTIGLLGASMAKMEAKGKGADDAWLVDRQGLVTEGSSSNAWIITAERRLVTRPLSPAILAGTTRAAIMRLAGEQDLRIEERAFSVEEAKAAAEAFITSAGHFVCPVVSIDGTAIGNGRPGSLVQRLRQLYLDEARRQAVTSQDSRQPAGG